MSRTSAPVRRVALALSGAELPAALLNPLLDAAQGHAPPALHAVFIEDADLLNAVALPFTAEFCTLTNLVRPIDRAQLEAHFLREAAACSRQLTGLAATLGRACTFEVVRERRANALLASLAAADMLLIARPRVQRRAGVATVRALIDGESGGGHCRELAARLAHALGAPLELLALAPPAARGGSDVRILRDVAAVRAQLSAPGAQLAVVTADMMEAMALTPHELDELCAAPLLVVR